MNGPQQGPDLGRMQEIFRNRLTRRGFLRGAGAGAVGISLGSLLAACGGDGGTGTDGGIDPAQIFSLGDAGPVNFANWPIYIDKAKDPDTGERYIPSLTKFTRETNIEVVYKEVIQENASFFGKLQPQLQAGQDTGWDIIVITDGWEFTALVVNDWVYPLDTSKRPFFDAHAAGWAQDPPFDPGAKHSMVYQSGLTGIAVNHDEVDAEITTLADLADPKKLAQGSLGMIKADMPHFVMWNLGIDPTTSTPADWKEAAGWLLKQRDTGIVRQYYEQGYVDDMTAGNLAASMAWSGDILYYALWGGYPNLEFVFPEGGCYHWTDNMLVPAGAEHPAAALELMDYFYKPDIATMLQEWVLYMSPCKDTQTRIQDDAAAADEKGWKGYARKLYDTASSEFLFPSADLLERTRFGRQLTTDDEKAEWDSIFEPISEQ
jgi:spermidine/putrescine transport system substrate-binding protein